MVYAHDFLLDVDGDLQFTSSGDILTGESDDQHVKHILLAYPGYYRESPLCGVGIESYLLSAGEELNLKRIVRIQLEADNYSLEGVSPVRSDIYQFILNIDPRRIR